MKFLNRALCLLFCISACRGSFLDVVKKSAEDEVRQLVEPVMQKADRLRDNIQEKQVQQKLFSVDMNRVDFDECAILTITLEQGAELVVNASVAAFSLSTRVSDSLWTLLGCPSAVPFYDVPKCLYTNLKNVKNELTQAKPLFVFYETKIEKLFSLVEQQFTTCVGESTTLPPAI